MSETEDEDDFVNVPSDLGESTHAEMRMLYNESAKTIHFAKHLQWWTVGSTLLTFGGIVAITRMLPNPEKFALNLVGVVIVIAMFVIFTLIIHQVWQHTELTKIGKIEKNFSTLFASVRRIKSSREANIYRYLLLLFMSSTVALGGAVTFLALQQFIP